MTRPRSIPKRPPDYVLEYKVHGETVHAPVWTITEGTVPREVLARVARGLLRRGREREAREAAEAEVRRLTPVNGRTQDRPGARVD